MSRKLPAAPLTRSKAVALVSMATTAPSGLLWALWLIAVVV